MKTAHYKMESPLGPLYLIASSMALHALSFEKSKGVFIENLEGDGLEVKILAKTVAQLKQYFAGSRREFDLPLGMEGTAFQKKVWKELSKIPYGRTFSYGDIAKRIHNGKAVRAVGTANGRNPIAIIVPCHRVIAADGTLGGYGGGLDRKTKLLEIENARWKD